MRKLIVLSFISLDGVMQAPGGHQEDTSGGFKYGGWSFLYSDEFFQNEMVSQLSRPFDLLLGRKTYDIFAGYWPKAENSNNPIGAAINKAVKYVASHSPIDSEWEKTVRLEGDLATAVKKLKLEKGPDLQVHGSGNMIQTLLKNDFIDELWLKFFPLTLGPGKRLFPEGTIPAGFELTSTKVSSKGIIFANYKRAGEITTVSF